jgi:hypothetical protein
MPNVADKGERRIVVAKFAHPNSRKILPALRRNDAGEIISLRRGKNVSVQPRNSSHCEERSDEAISPREKIASSRSERDSQ